ncbi:MAG TPA: hypothetical protein PKN48_00295 [Bacteroidales bacterium]|nr:hypothetical protein [Bacteroidales bacterium]
MKKPTKDPDSMRVTLELTKRSSGSLLFDFFRQYPAHYKTLKNAQKYTDGLFAQDGINTITAAKALLKQVTGGSAYTTSDYVTTVPGLNLQFELILLARNGRLPRVVVVRPTKYWLNVHISDIELGVWTRAQRDLFNRTLAKYTMLGGITYKWTAVSVRRKRGYQSLQTRSLFVFGKSIPGGKWM